MMNKPRIRVAPAPLAWSRWILAAGLLCTAAAAATPEVQEWTAPSGTRVLFIETHEIPAVNVRITFAGGASRDGEHPGIARLTSNLLMAGTEKLDANALARAYEREGARVSTGSARDMAWVELRSLSDDGHLWPVVRTVAALAAKPAFAPTAIERLKSQQRISLTAEAQSPGALAARAFWEAVYGDHPYGHDPLGTPESIDAISRADIRAFHQRYYAAANANLAIVGDLARADAERLARMLIEPLPRGEAAPPLPPVPPMEATTIRQPFPSTQSHVLLGRWAVARGYAHWPALVVANHILGGGGFSSRLLTEVREKRGLVYGVSSGFSPMAAKGPFIIQFPTRGDQTEEALAVVRQQLKQFVEEGPTPEEVRNAIANISGGFPLMIDSNAELTGYLAMIGFYDLPTDYLSEFRARIEAVDAEAARAAFAEVIGNRPQVQVIVGGGRARASADH